jgi:formate/nitrite transporter
LISDTIIAADINQSETGATMSDLAGHNMVDALLPPEMAERAESVGVAKTRLEIPKLLMLAVLAGAFIGFGSMFSVVVTAGADGMLPYGVTRLLGGLAFSLGLILVIVGGAELFTGNNLMVMACASGKVGFREVLRAWGLVYVGNFIGAAGLAFLVFLASGYSHGGGSVGVIALASADNKASLSALQSVIHGVLANVLVCLATWLCYSARTTTDKILAIVPPIAAFSAAGFEHSIANMFLLSFALMTKFGAPAAFWGAIGQGEGGFPHLTILLMLKNILWVTLGNMMGGVLVGITYWFIYLRKRERA